MKLIANEEPNERKKRVFIEVLKIKKNKFQLQSVKMKKKKKENQT